MADAVRILYLDDDAGLGVLLARAFASSGYQVESVQTGEDAIARLQQGRYDVFALDHNLTNEVGLDIIPKVRAMPDAPPIIYVTGSEDVRIAVAALKAGAVDYVWKDVQGHYRELLRQAVDTAIAQERMQREREQAQRQIAEARDRAEMLLKEVNHRVANSLAIVSSMVQMQAMALGDNEARAVLRDTQARISAVAGIHKRLYTSSDVRFVELNDYLRSLVQELEASLSLDRIKLKFEATGGEARMPTDKAVSLGIVITELVTNAAKYAYAPGANGEIRVRATALSGGGVEISVEDDGVGWTGEGPIRGSGMGSKVVKAMTMSLNSKLHYDPSFRGTRAVLPIAPGLVDTGNVVTGAGA
jgi:two-component sensor histidine kinase/CheY-like chemotaxis protein